MWFNGWSDVLRVLAVGPAAYALVVLVLRVSGKRMLAKLNAFDLVVTVALGSTLATIFLNKDVSWSEGATAFAALALLQFVVATVTTRLPRGRSVVTAQPTMLLQHGRMLEGALREQRVTQTEVRQAIRTTGIGDVSAVAAVVLESDGTFSVISHSRLGSGSALKDVNG